MVKRKITRRKYSLKKDKQVSRNVKKGVYKRKGNKLIINLK